MQVVTANFARKLERERDEAQKELSSIHRWIERNHADGFIDSQTYWQNLERVTENWYDRIDAIEADARRFVRERDEARVHWGTESMNAAQFFGEKIKAIAERDKARADADELASVAAHCLGWHDHESPDAAIKIAAALKRWKKSK
jgi:hypothetical protein